MGQALTGMPCALRHPRDTDDQDLGRDRGADAASCPWALAAERSNPRDPM